MLYSTNVSGFKFQVSCKKENHIFVKRWFVKKYLFIALITVFSPEILSQPLNSIYDNNRFVSFEKSVYDTDSLFHTSIRPYLISDIKRKTNNYSLLKSHYIQRFLRPHTPHRTSQTLNLVFNRNLVEVRKKDYGFTIDPLFDFGLGKDFRNERSTWINTRGFMVEGWFGKNFAFSTKFYETQSKVPLWIDNYVRRRYIMPGQGIAKDYSSGALDYANSSGYVSYSPGKYINFQLGHGKHFWGDGYRSMILSDHSLYHPYFMITSTFWKIRYVNLYSQFSHPDIKAYQGSGDPVFAKKYNTMHYLSFIPWKKFNISIFESITWMASDTSFHRGYDFNYLNPIIFYRPVEFNISGGDNAMMGMNLRYSPLSWLTFYSQFVFDEMKVKELVAGNGWMGNKHAWQLGFKSFDILGIQNLNFQAEYNLIRPYMYSHYNQLQNYSNAKEPLAHPSGSNIKEAVAIAKYNYKRLYFNLKYVWSATGLDSAGINYGKNIFNNPQTAPKEYGNFTGQGIYTTLNQVDGSVAFLVNPSTNANIYLETTYRTEKNSGMDNSYLQISFGFRTSLRNLYYDFY